MLLSDRMPPGAVLRLPGTASREELFPLLVGALCEAHGFDQFDRILSGVLERESRAPTSVGQGIAVPHARLEAATGLLAAAAVCPSGLDFPVPDGEPVRLVFLLVSPPAGAALHLKALAAVGRIPAALSRELRDAVDAADFLARLRGGEIAAGATA